DDKLGDTNKTFLRPHVAEIIDTIQYRSFPFNTAGAPWENIVTLYHCKLINFPSWFLKVYRV
ncbi:MAG: hypothetical protein KAH21_13220, partial [Spirochaetaceae bacterium]|nr:hypothetical protein [Spirochaetaceae bacterium]